jgi:two-component system invasion response regulator UvrY
VLRVLIADSHPVVRRGLKEILQDEFPGIQVGEAKNGREVLDEVDRLAWDVAILDMTVAGVSTADVLKEVKRKRPNLPVLIFGTRTDAPYGKRVLTIGASGYINKEMEPADLAREVRNVLEGDMYVSPAIGKDSGSRSKLPVSGRLHENLSDREFEVLRMIGSGKTITQIARDLHLTVTTVSTYRARVLIKLSMKTTAELMYYAISNNLI